MQTAANPRMAAPERSPHRHMSKRNRLLFFLVAWLIVLMPFLFWRGTWFGRPLSDSTVGEYLHDTAKPRHIQHALVQIGERMSRKDATVARWYPDLVQLASSPVEEVRNTDAWVMGQDPARPEFHEALLKMLRDESMLVRGNAALALVRFGDTSGHDQIVSLLAPTVLKSPAAGLVSDTAKVGEAVRQQGIVVRLQSGERQVEVRTPITGRVRALDVRRGVRVSEAAEVAVIAPASDQVWEALRALYLIGSPEDLPAVTAYERELPDMPDRIRQQAVQTAKAIRQRQHP